MILLSNNPGCKVLNCLFRLCVVVVVLSAGFYSVLLATTDEISAPRNHQILQQQAYAISSTAPLTKSAEKNVKPDVVVAHLPSTSFCPESYFHSDSEPLDQPKIVAGQVLTQFVSSAL